jgi:uncharacterized protein (TIGR04222 family)
MNTWGISGAAFLALYVVITAAVTSIAFRFRQRALAGERGGTAVSHFDLQPYEIAMLNGGERLAVAAAVAELRSHGLIEPGERRGTVVATAGRRSVRDSLEAEILHALDPKHGGGEWTVDELRAELRERHALDSLRQRLTTYALIPAREQLRTARGSALMLLPVIALGIARIVAGVGNDKPVGYLTILVFAVAAAFVWLMAAPIRRTKAGDAALASLRSAGVRHDAAVAPAGLGAAVALDGTAALWAADPGFARTIGAGREGGWLGGYGGGGGCGGGGCGGGGGGCGG